MTAHTHLFIGGLHRSGTSLLHRLLAAHPAVSGFSGTGAREDEGQHLQSVFPPASAFGGPGRFAFDARAHLDEASPLVTEANRRTLQAEWGAHWDRSKPFLLEKSPPNLIRARFLQAMFPGSRFIFLIRHPLAVGYATQKWSRAPIEALVAHWVAAHRAMLEDLPHLAHYTLLRYEALAADPHGTLDGLCRGLDLAPQALAEKVRPDANSTYFAQWENEINRNPNKLSEMEALSAWLGRFGYGFSPPYTHDWNGPPIANSNSQ